MTTTLDDLGQHLLESTGSKEGVAIALGFLPGELAWRAKSTYGLPLVIITIWAHQKKLRMDWDGFEYAAAKEGVDVSAEVHETRRELRL